MVREYKRKRNKRYTILDLQNAISHVEKGSSLREASRIFNVPLTTLYDRISGKHTNKAGHPTSLTKTEENIIISSLEYCSENGYPCDRRDLADIVKDYSSKCARQFPSTLSPGIDFIRSFEKRWMHRVTLRKPELLSKARVRSLTKDSIESFFEMLTNAKSGHLGNRD